MKNLFAIIPFAIFIPLSAHATTYRNITTGTPLWSDPNSWYINETSQIATTPPTAGDTIYAFYNSATPSNPFKLYVDIDATILRINTNYTAGSTVYQLNDLDGTTPTTLTIDGASSDSSSILLSFSSGDNITGNAALLGFDGIEGSQLKLTNSLNENGSVNFRFSGKGNVLSRTISIGQNVEVLADRDVYFYGALDGVVDGGGVYYNIGGSVEAKDGDTYKDIYLDGSTGGMTMTLASSATMTANNISIVGSKTNIVLDGQMNILKNSDYTMSTGSLTINGNLNVGSNAFNFSGGNLTIGSESAITAGSINIKANAANSTFTVAEGASFTPTTLIYNTKQTIYVNGTLNTTLSNGGMLNINVGQNGVYNVTNRSGSSQWTIFGGDWNVSGKVVTNGFSNDSKIASGHMTVNEGALIVHNSGGMNLDGYQSVWSDIGPKAILTLNASNAFRTTEGGSQSSYFLNVSRGNVRIEVNADNTFSRLGFSTITDAAQAATLTLFIADGVLFEVSDISGLKEENLASLVLENFDNNKIKVTNAGTIDFSKISSSDTVDGEQKWGNFRIENDFLVADLLVPEPSEIAAIFGALALVLAICRKRK